MNTEERKNHLQGLNPRQIQAVEHFGGPLLIIAGAGTGKTRVITHRIAYLIENLGVLPRNVLALTFTNKAAGEMRDRVSGLIGEHSRGVLMSTFHSFCNYILRREIGRLGDFTDGYTIYDEADCRSCMKDILKSSGLQASGPFAPGRVLELISRAKNFESQPSENLRPSDPLADYIDGLYEKYEERLKENNALDFDNLMIKTVFLFEHHREVIDRYRRRFSFVLVDEFQDTNRVQYRLLTQLAPPDGNVTVVGDMDQSIYGWRGADVGNIVSFESDFKNVTVVPLEQNYRSKQRILDTANELILKNNNVHEKRLWSELGEGDPVNFYLAWDEHEEAQFVTRKTDSLLSEGYLLNDVAVLFRTRAQSRVIEEHLMRAAVPYVFIGATEFYKRKEIKDVIAYLRVLHNPRDFVSFARIANEPRRGIGDKSVGKIEAEARRIGSLFELPDREKELSKDFPKKAFPVLKLLKSLSSRAGGMSISAFVDAVVRETGYYGALAKEELQEGVSRTENVDEFISLAAEYERGTGKPELEGFLSHLALVSDADVTDTGDDRIKVMTLHSAKGLEFPIVFIMGFEEGLLPHASSQSEGEIEEERRLCYVGITRAREHLYVSASRSRMMHGSVGRNDVSRFLFEAGEHHFKVLKHAYGEPAPGESFLDEDESVAAESAAWRSKRAGDGDEFEGCEPDYIEEGDIVLHKAFGRGTVLSMDGGEICVSFPGRGPVRLSAKFAPLRKV